MAWPESDAKPAPAVKSIRPHPVAHWALTPPFGGVKRAALRPDIGTQGGQVDLFSNWLSGSTGHCRLVADRDWSPLGDNHRDNDDGRSNYRDRPAQGGIRTGTK